MGFHFPLAWTGLILAVPVVAFYLLRQRPRRVTVATDAVWKKLISDRSPRSIWLRLRHLPSLLMQLAVLLLILTALAEPWFGAQSSGRRLIIVIDNSLSMSARNDDGVSRFEEACTEALGLIRSLQRDDQAAVLLSAPKPVVLSGFSKAHSAISRSIQESACSEFPAVITDAVDAAESLSDDSGNCRIVVLTDRTSPERPEGTEFIQVGQPADNAAITDLQISRVPGDRETISVMVTAANFSMSPAELSIQIAFDNELRDVIPMSLPASEVVTGFCSIREAGPGTVTASLSLQDGIPADNARTAEIASAPAIRVALSGEPSWFLQQAVESVPFAVPISSSEPNESNQPVCEIRYRSDDTSVPAGSVLLIAPQAASEFWEIDDQLSRPAVVAQDDESPLLNHVDLRDVLLSPIRLLRPTVNHEILAEAADGSPICFRIRRPEGDLIVLTADLQRSDLPLRTAFPILLSNILREAAVSNPADTRNGETAIDPGPAAARLAEADLRSSYASAGADGVQPAAESSRTAMRSLFGGQLWSFAAMAALLLLAADWWLLQRRLLV